MKKTVHGVRRGFIWNIRKCQSKWLFKFLAEASDHQPERYRLRNALMTRSETIGGPGGEARGNWFVNYDTTTPATVRYMHCSCIWLNRNKTVAKSHPSMSNRAGRLAGSLACSGATRRTRAATVGEIYSSRTLLYIVVIKTAITILCFQFKSGFFIRSWVDSNGFRITRSFEFFFFFENLKCGPRVSSMLVTLRSQNSA